MKHIDDDKLVQYALEAYQDQDEGKKVETHLADCPQCRASLAAIRKELDLIGSLRPGTEEYPIPVIRQRKPLLFSLARSAALIIFGTCIGLGLAHLNRPQQICVLPAYDRAQTATFHQAGYVIAEATAVKLNMLIAEPDGR
jgi:anti-sigma factor RsiW